MDEKKPVDPPEKLHIEQVNMEVKDVTDYSKITDEFRQSRKGQINNILQNAFQAALKEVAETFPSEGEYAAVSDLENAILLQVFQVMTKEVRKEEGAIPGMSIDEDVFPELTVFIATQWWSNHNKAAIGGLSKEELKNHLQHIKALIPYLQKQVTDEVSLNDLVQEIDLYGNPEKKAKHAAAIKKAIESMQADNSAVPPAKAAAHLNSILADHHTMPNTKFSNELPYDFVNEGPISLAVGKGKKNQPIYTLATVTAEFGDDVKLTGRPYTEFDRSVSDAIISLYLYGHGDHAITSEMVYRQMTHKTETEHISPQQKSAVTKSIEKQRRIHAQIDASEEFERRGLKTPDGYPVKKLGGMLLVATDAEFEAGGKIVSGYYITQSPLQLVYAQMTNQLITVDARLLDVKEVDSDGNLTSRSVRIEEYGIPVRDYIIRRISIMKRDRKNRTQNQSTHIRYDQIYKIAGIDVTNRDSTNRIRIFTRKVLDFLTASNFIDGYEVLTERRKVTAVNIILPSTKIK